jgi:hypothetical protein
MLLTPPRQYAWNPNLFPCQKGSLLGALQKTLLRYAFGVSRTGLERQICMEPSRIDCCTMQASLTSFCNRVSRTFVTDTSRRSKR